MAKIDKSNQKGQIALYVASLLVATVAIVCRLWARRIMRSSLQVNDWLMILAYISVAGLVFSANLAVIHGRLGTHFWEMPKELLPQLIPFNIKMTIVIPFFQITACYLTNLSVTHFYITLFPYTVIYTLCRIQFVVLILGCIASILRCFLICRPLHYAWDRTVPGGKCDSFRDFALEMSVVALVFDLTCVLLPVPVVWNLRLSYKEKIRITVLFGLGLLICTLTALRLYRIEDIDFNDLTGTAHVALMLGVSEPALFLVAGCLPIILPLFRIGSNKIKATYAERLGPVGIYLKTRETALTEQILPSFVCPCPQRPAPIMNSQASDEVPSLGLGLGSRVVCVDTRTRARVDPLRDSRIAMLTVVKKDSGRASLDKKPSLDR